ncbi:hypothetical protein Bca52824_034599 [Brassica carinata]|uniref:Uncharacterized protein n=1 Tax=Brassica carinata TaxID=52824 RepID=A0A8X7V0X3_BRACI|nr:hypothetical protein Bca52824_034599 [Brassica carinata]
MESDTINRRKGEAISQRRRYDGNKFDSKQVCFAAMFGIGSAMSVIRGKDDLTMVSGSGCGLAYSFVSQSFKVKPAHALSHAAWYAVVSGTGYKVRETNRSCDAQDALYTETRIMLSKLGLEEYENNFKKAHLTDPTLPLLTDRLYIHPLQA